MYGHILIPTDGSEFAEHAVTSGLSLAKSLGAKVTVIIVEEPFNWLVFAEQGGSGELAKLTEQIKKNAASVLNRVANAANRPVCPVKRFRWKTRNPIKPSLQRPLTGAAISSSWHRTGAAAYPHLCSAV